MLKQGLYEQVVNTEIKDELRQLPEDSRHIEKIDAAESSSVLTQYLSEVVHKGLDRIAGDDISAQLNLVNKIVDLISQETAQDDLRDFTVGDEGEQLFALLSRDDPMMRIGRKKAKDLPRPETSIAQSSLFTGAVHEPQMFSELKKEIASADRIDMLVSFVKWSGLRLIIDDLQHFADRGGRLRVITTTYMGATDVKAVEALRKLPNTEIRVSYDTERTRLHAKAYMFYRETGFTTAYVGSSNLSNPAMSSGLEWNVKLTTKDMLPTIQKMEATFDSYWNTASFEVYEGGCRERLERALSANGKANPTSEMQFVFDIQPYPYQQEILDRLQAEREVRGYYRNLVVAATGTGKTLISAFDYRRFCKAFSGSKPRLLFVVHREEILKQSRSAFRAVLKDPNFGELFVGSFKPSSLEHLFISVPKNVREGVKWLPDKQVNVFFITLNKADKDYSPTTMYNDYSINESLFHWQSQSTTSDTASTGQRYINHRQRGSKVVLFVREFKQDSIGAAPYTCLGTAAYVRHTGSRPMNITLHLDQPIPAKYLRKTNKLVVG